MRGILLDLDDTLYAYEPCEKAAREALSRALAERTSRPEKDVEAAFLRARDRVKARNETPSKHHRLIYLAELAHAEHPALLGEARALERLYWEAYLSAARLRPGAKELFGLRHRGFKIAIVTDLTLDVQLRKLEHLGLFAEIDALVASEEVGKDKPARDAFDLGARRIGVPLDRCVVVGDSAEKDGEGARLVGLPFFHVKTGEGAPGQPLDAVVRALEGLA